MTVKNQIMQSSEIQSVLEKIADKIFNEFKSRRLQSIGLLGIQQRGVPMVHRIADYIKKQSGYSINCGEIDINMYRDDIGIRSSLPVIHSTNIPFDINSRPVVIVDDVLQSGRTIRAAFDAITDYGRPSMVRLGVLIDRGFREFPIHADYVGKKVSVKQEDKIRVLWKEIDGEDSIVIQEKQGYRGVE